MAAGLSKEQQWEKLKIWIEESMAAIRRGSLERLPATFTGERAEAAIDAYETCLEAMRFLEDWERFGLPRKGDERSHE